LRERSLAITPLVELIAGRIVAELGGSEVSFTPEALARLQTYMWPGNIVELESVLNRSLASLGSIEPSLLVDTNDLLFTADGAGTASRRPRPSTAPTAQLRPQSQPSAGFENLIAGLAHDLRNPITSIKTFADLISSGSATPEDAATLGRVAAADCLTLSSRIEVLQEFGGLGQPLPKNLDLLVSAAEVVAACDQFQRVQLRAEEPLLLCCDRAQLRFVLTNLLAATLDECATDGAVVVLVEDGSLCFKVEAGRRPIAALRRLANAGDENISWRIALAGAVATRNGGSVKLGFEGETMTVTLGLPRARSEEESSGKQANRTDS
jgi:signal transduction histidine kinase